MKRNIAGLLLVCAAITSGLSTRAQSGDQFNSRAGIALSQVKMYLQNHCWSFPGFDINQNGWTPSIEGNGAMVSKPVIASSVPGSGIYSPLLDIREKLTVSFKYKFSSSLEAGTDRSLKIYLTDAEHNVIEKLDGLEFSTIDPAIIYTYNKTFTPAGAGVNRIFLQYEGTGGDTRIAIDALNISAPLHYTSGCNASPLAVNDRISGLADRTATGNVAANDLDANKDALSTYLIAPSRDGNVVLARDGSFSFTPHAGFKGSSTSFTYKVCDGGEGALCSNDATVTINFPPLPSLQPVGLSDFKGLYQNDGKVELTWATNRHTVSDHFDIERSFDGNKWEKAGSQQAQGDADALPAYNFIDNVGRNTANKKDIYYRLKQVDAKGNMAYSRLLVVRVYNTRSLKMVSVTPNPSLNDIAVNVQLNQRSFVVMKVLDEAGSEIMRKALNAEEGANSYLMDGTNKLQPGAYSLEVTVNSRERMNVKLLKE